MGQCGGGAPSRSGGQRASGAGKTILPDELPGRVGVLSLQGVGQIDLAVAGGPVLLVEQAHPFYLAAQFGDDGLRQGGRCGPSRPCRPGR